MRTGRLLVVLGVLVGSGAFGGGPSAETPGAVFHTIGDLEGGGYTTIVRDATRVGDVIYAVGGAVARRECPAPCSGNPDTVVEWRSDTGALEPLPDFVANTSQLALNGGQAITPDARYIASQARLSVTPTVTVRAVRVDTSLLPSAAANLNLNTTFSPALTGVTTALAMSNDGAILYGVESFPSLATPPRAVRFDTAGQTSAVVPTLPGFTSGNVSARGTSADGNVAVGVNNAVGVFRGYRYEHLSGAVTAVPLLDGGSVNNALAVSPDGRLVLAIGSSAEYPRGEAYIYDASTGATQPLGSPNAAWSPGGRVCANGGCSGPPSPVAVGGVLLGGLQTGGMTADGSVVAMSFWGLDGQSGYFRNEHGWFHLTSVLGANGIDLAGEGWNANTLFITGMSADGTLVFGAGERTVGDDLVVDGFVAEFAPGVLASFDPRPTPPVSTAIVGVWSFLPDTDEPIDPGAPDHVVVFTAGGVYYHVEGEPGEPLAGFERGAYTFDGTRVALTTLYDTNGSTGLSDSNGTSFSASVIGDTLWDGEQPLAMRITGRPGAIVGGWVGGNPAEARNSFLIAFAETRYFAVHDFPDGTHSESGTYTWNPVTHELIATTGGEVDAGTLVTLAPDARSVTIVADGEETFTLSRVVDPATIPVIANTPLSASGIAGQAFSHLVTATNTVTFSAAGLPGGLSIDSVSGTISGTPAVGGQFAATIGAANAEGVSDIQPLVLTIAIPTPVGQAVVVEPQVPEGQGPITLTFDEITTAGTTEVTLIDLDESGIPPPGNVSVGGVVYEVTTTATFSGLITLCFSYAGIDFGDAEPRLFHFENGVWVDITTSVDPGTQTICGATTSLSPFAILISDIVRTGFYSPINPVAGFLNTVKGGATVPLRFEVFVNGVEQTTTEGLVMTQQQVECDANAPIEDVEPASVTGGTTLRYDEAGGYFVQNWRVPNTRGRCYMVRMTTTADGLALTARFKVR